jgi:hypothetical protein
MQNTNFEIEIWQDPNKIKKILFYIVIIILLAWTSCIIGKVYWNDYVTTEITLRGKIKYVGWPVKLYYYGMFIGIAGIISLAIVNLIRDNKHPTLAMNKNGLYINQQLIKQTTVIWKDVEHVELKQEQNAKIISIYFNEIDKIINAQSSIKRAFLKENLKDNKPLKCSDKFSKGDLVVFYEKAVSYINKNS